MVFFVPPADRGKSFLGFTQVRQSNLGIGQLCCNAIYAETENLGFTLCLFQLKISSY